MRRSVSLACSVITGVALIALPATQAQASENHQVRIWGSMELNDDEGWLSSDEHRTVVIDRTVTVGNSRPGGQFTISECVGDEVRVELVIDVIHAPNGTTQQAEVHAYLYEGASCDTTELNGRSFATLTTQDTATGVADTATTTLTVQNDVEDIPGDNAVATLHMDARAV